MKTILVTGTPGTGKSLLSSHLEEKLSAKGLKVLTINISDLIKKERLYDEYDSRLDTYLIDDRKVRKHLDGFLPSQECNADICILETHTVTAIPKGAVDICAVLTCRTDVLYDRLTARGYSKVKIDENMECEIMRIVLEEAHDRFSSKSATNTKARIIELPSNTDEDLQDNTEAIFEIL